MKKELLSIVVVNALTGDRVEIENASTKEQNHEFANNVCRGDIFITTAIYSEKKQLDVYSTVKEKVWNLDENQVILECYIEEV